MDYHIARNGQQLGIFSENQIRENLNDGVSQKTDLAWCEGMTDWRSLEELFPESEGVSSPPRVLPQTVAPVTLMSSPKNSGLAIASLVCGILSFFTCGLTGLPGIICGHLALSRIRQSAGTVGGKGIAIGGLVTSYFGFLLIGIFVLAGMAFPAFAKIQEKGKQTLSVSNARQIVVACQLYANEHENRFPDDLEVLLREGIAMDGKIFRDPLSRDSSPVGYDYYGKGKKDTDQADTIILTSKSSDSRGRKVVARLDGSVGVESPPLDR
ncbi:hypothetical protein BH11VER1_BH11VER1_02820 [soil metagenome]